MKFIKIASFIVLVLLSACIVIPGETIVVTHTPPPTGDGPPVTDEGPPITAQPTSPPVTSDGPPITAQPTSPPVTSEGPPITTQPTSPGPPTASPTPTETFTPGPPTHTPTATFTPTATHTPAPTDTPGPTSTPLPVLHSDGFGVQIHPLIHEDEMFNLLTRTKFDVGARWIKFQVEWELLEPQPGVRGNEWWVIHNHVQLAHDNGFEVLISIVNAPDWARTPVNIAEYPNNPHPEQGPPDDYQLYANFVNDMAQGFANRIDAIEVWNEPNLQREWFGKPLGGAEYMLMFDAVYRTVRAGSNPNIMLITAGLAPTGINDHVSAVDDRQFLREMYAAGLASYQNVALGIHPYGWGNPPSETCCTAERGWADNPTFFFLNTINDYRAIMETNGDSARTMWATEFGWPSFDGFGVEPDPAFAYFNYVSEWDQAHYIVEALAYAESQPFIAKMFLWNMNWAAFHGGDGIQPMEQEAGYSIIRPDGNPRPAYQLLQQVPKEGHPALTSPNN